MDRQRIMVFLIDGLRTGFIVDSVAEVLKIHKSAIEPAPVLSAEQAKLLAGGQPGEAEAHGSADRSRAI
jgi:purine-binding chemotaxis protein CheW